MTPEEIGRILDEIGERIGPAGEYAWQITVRQVYIESFVFLLVGVGLVGLSFLCVLGMRKWRAWYRIQPDYRSSDEIPPGADWIVFAGTVWAGLVLIGTNVVQLLNPEYHAMTRLLERLIP